MTTPHGLSIVDYSDELAPEFYSINAQWIESMFRLEDTDKDVLSHPRERIIDAGGIILFARADGLGIVGTCALQKTGDGQYELTKMGVLETARGRKVGEFLLREVIERAKRLGAKRLYLLTSSKCAPAIHLYEKLGFQHDAGIMRDFGARYQRCDVAMLYVSERLATESLVVAAGRAKEPGSSLNRPLVAASNFILGGERGYTRDDGTETWEALEDIVGGLENGQCVAFASGMAGAAAIFDQLGVGSTIVLPDDCYQGVVALAEQGQAKGFWTVTRLPVDDTAAWIAASKNADLLWLESPSNPLLIVADIAAICAASRKPSAIVAVDNTFATPLNQQPLDLGAHYAFQSATKFIGGHSDLLAGVVTVRDTKRRDALRRSRKLSGATPGALEAFLAARGARTLALRFERAQANAQILAERLENHPNVTRVRYPGLTSHPTHAIAKAQLRGFGTMISFDVRGDAASADAVCTTLRLINHATSLGAVESTIERRAALWGQQHLPPTLLRLSVGIEDVEDLWRDLDRALRLLVLA